MVSTQLVDTSLVVADARQLADVEGERIRLAGDHRRVERLRDVLLAGEQIAGDDRTQRLADVQVRRLCRCVLGDRALGVEHLIGEREVARLHRRLERAPGRHVPKLVAIQFVREPHEVSGEFGAFGERVRGPERAVPLTEHVKEVITLVEAFRDLHSLVGQGQPIGEIGLERQLDAQIRQQAGPRGGGPGLDAGARRGSARVERGRSPPQS